MSGFRQSFAWWSFTAGREVDGPAFLAQMAAAGAQGVEMAPEALWPAARDAGLSLVTLTGHQPLEIGFNDRDNHLKLQDKVRASIALAQTHGVEKVIVFSGVRKGRADAEGIANTVEGLAPLVRSEIWSCLESLKNTGLSVLVIDKNIGPLLRIADSHFVLDKGRTVWSGSSQSLLDQKDILKETLGV